MLVPDSFLGLSSIDLVNLEQMYTELENNYYELQKTVDIIITEKNQITQELEAERARHDELKVDCFFLHLVLE